MNIKYLYFCLDHLDDLKKKTFNKNQKLSITIELRKIYMLQLLPQSDTLTPNTTNPNEAVEFISSYIDKYHCENMSVDISYMNILDACYVSTLCATKHFTKYPTGRIVWKVSSQSVQDFNKDLELGNSQYIL